MSKIQRFYSRINQCSRLFSLGLTPLEMACISDHVKLAVALLNCGIIPKTPQLLIAYRHKSAQVFRLLLNSTRSFESRKFLLQFKTAFSSELSSVETFLRNPLSLKGLCRIFCLHHFSLKQINSQCLPATVLQYLRFDEL